MRGARKAAVAATLLAAGAGAGALAGFAAGVAWAAARLPALPLAGAAAVVALAAGADWAHRRGRAPAPLALRRQVPQVWSELFSPATVALLYGARLGVGPLTVLPSWSWWAALVTAASLGPGAGAVAGAVFGAVRGLVMLAAAEAVQRDSVRRMGVLVGAEPHAHRALLTAAAAVCALALL